MNMRHLYPPETLSLTPPLNRESFRGNEVPVRNPASSNRFSGLTYSSAAANASAELLKRSHRRHPSWTQLLAFLAIAFSFLVTVSVPAQVRNAAPDQQTTAEAPDTETPAGTNEAQQNGLQKRGVQREAIVTFGRDVELKAGDSAKVVVVIGGSAKIHGKVHDAVVAIGGDVDVDGEVDHEVVAIMG